MEEDIKSEIENMKEGERILFSIGLELFLRLTSWDDIVEKCKYFNKKCFNNKQHLVETLKELKSKINSLELDVILYKNFNDNAEQRNRMLMEEIERLQKRKWWQIWKK